MAAVKARYPHHTQGIIGRDHKVPKDATFENPRVENSPIAFVHGKYVKVYLHEGYEGVYSRADSGQCRYGGWSRDGIKRWVALRKANNSARRTANSKAMEDAILALLQEKNKTKKEAPPAPNNVGNQDDDESLGVDFSDSEPEDAADLGDDEDQEDNDDDQDGNNDGSNDEQDGDQVDDNDEQDDANGDQDGDSLTADDGE